MPCSGETGMFATEWIRILGIKNERITKGLCARSRDIFLLAQRKAEEQGARREDPSLLTDTCQGLLNPCLVDHL